MNRSINKQKVVTSLFWKFLEHGGAQGLLFVFSIILARLLSPADFGLIALTTIFISISTTFIKSGFYTSLIQQKNIDEKDLSSVFYLSLFAAFVFYILIFFTAPYIAKFYEESQLIIILRVLSLTLFTGVICSIFQAIVTRNMMFKKLFYSSLISIGVSGVIGISMAYLQFGIWALIAQQISASLTLTIVLFFMVKWRPKVIFSLKRIKILFSYGWKILAAGMLESIYIQIRALIIGKTYSSAILGYYNRGEALPHQIIAGLNGTIQSVMFPTLSAHQEDTVKVKKIVKRSISVSTFLVFPIMIGMAIVARPLISVVLTDKWLPSVPYIQIFCLAYMLWPIHTTNLQVIKALGHSDIYLKLEVIKKVIGVSILLISIPYGTIYMTLGVPISGLIAIFINAYPNKKLLDYSFKEQAKDIFPASILSITMGSMIYPINLIGLNDFLTLSIQIILGIVIYIGAAKLFNVESYKYLLCTVKELFITRTSEN